MLCACVRVCVCARVRELVSTDLEEIGDLEGYIERTSTILVYCSRGYFTSKNCMRELVATYTMEKPIIALTEPDTSRGGLSLAEVHTQLSEADAMYVKWGFWTEACIKDEQGEHTAECHKGVIWPGGEALYDKLYADEPIEWNRIGHFQDVTMRLIAERVLPGASGQTYVDREIVNSELGGISPPKASFFHLYCSEVNPGAKALMLEVGKERGFDVLFEEPSSGQPDNVLYVTTDVANLSKCEHMLLYLTGQTWTRAEASAALAGQVIRAMDLEVHVLLVHEMPGSGGQEARFGCEFGCFFSHPEGATPTELLSRGIYSEIAVPLKVILAHCALPNSHIALSPAHAPLLTPRFEGHSLQYAGSVAF